MENVSLLVSYQGLADGASSSPRFWSVTDDQGFSYFHHAFGIDPQLDSAAARPEKGVQGWVTFEIPKGTARIEATESRTFDDPLVWVIVR